MRRGYLMSKMTRRGRIIAFLDAPTTKPGIAFNLIILGLIYASVSLLVIELRYPDKAESIQEFIRAANNFILFLFAGDLLVRLTVYRNRLRYLFSFYGLTDILAVVPGLLSLIIPGVANLTWLRVFRIVRVLRFLRLLKFARQSSGAGAIFGGIVQLLIPWIALAAGFKGLILAAEAQPWWPGVGDLGVAITVAGFAISVLLGAKLGVVQNRFYDVEDAICRILGSVTDMKKTDETGPQLSRWVTNLKESIESNSVDRYQQLREETRRLEQTLEQAGIGGPVTAGFHRDVEFLIHRLRTRTPPFLERFLRYVTVVYTSIAILTIPGFTGFFMVVLIVFVLGGMYFLIDDMDNPLASGNRSMLSIDLTPLYEYRVAAGSFGPGARQEASSGVA